MEFSADELISPDWLDGNYLEKIVSQYENDKTVKIVNYEILPGTKPGEHFASVMYRSKIIYTKKNKINNELNVLIKIKPFIDGIKKDILNDNGMFETEIRMYGKTIQEMESLLKMSGDTTSIGPRLVYQTLEPEPIIILEDASQYGYKMTQNLCDFETTRKAIIKIAKWHACSYYIGRNNMEVYNVGVFTEKNRHLMAFAIEGIKVYTNLLKTDKSYERYVVKLEKMLNTFVDNGINIYTANKDNNGYNVLNHGDFHMKNMLFKHDKENKLEDVMFLDFQLCFWGSPAIDLIYTLYAIASAETRDNHREDLIKIYHNEFIKTLSEIGFMGKGPSLHDLQLELLKYGFLETIITLWLLPMFYMDFSKLKIEDIIEQKEDMSKSFYSHPEYFNVSKGILPRLLTRGFLG